MMEQCSEMSLNWTL